MMPRATASSDPRSLALRRRIDAICSAFETAFSRETTARIEPFVAQSPEPDRPHVLAELIWTERECRQMIGDDPTEDEYLTRFPRDEATVRTVFGDTNLKPGDRVGKYVVTAKIGAGGMGVVYRATDEVVGRPVALKMLAARLTASASARKRLLAEARAVGLLSHPNVVTLFEAGDGPGVCYLAMEYIAGGSAADRLVGRKRFDWCEAVAIMIDVCHGLAAAHAAGLVHLDIKPGNILLTDRTDRAAAAKVSDFGLARRASDSGEDERLAGTPRYMAPEQMAGLPTDSRTDVYGVGATLYALLTGTPPQLAANGGTHKPPDPRTLVPEVPASVSRVVRRALHPSPAARYQSMTELLGDLERSLSDHPLRHRWPVVGVAILALLACGLLVRHLTFRPITPPGTATTAGSSDARPREPELEAAPEAGPWEPLFDGKTLAGWEARRGPPAGMLEPSKPRENDPAFSVTIVDGHPAIHGVPDGDCRLTTIRGFENYHLRLEYRWGRPAQGERLNAGVMYHYQQVALDDRLSKVRFMELDLWPPEVGHLHSLPDVSLKRETIDPRNYELPAPAWNRVDLLCVGDRCVHAVNGHVTVSYRDTRIVFGSEATPYTSGRIQLQSMSGEVFFRNIQVRPIRSLSAQHYR